MLKIKDNIPLAVLEKFLFKELGKQYEKYFGSEILIVRKSDRRIYIETHNIWDIAEDCLGLIYDLIKADMAEKVEN